MMINDDFSQFILLLLIKMTMFVSVGKSLLQFASDQLVRADNAATSAARERYWSA